MKAYLKVLSGIKVVFLVLLPILLVLLFLSISIGINGLSDFANDSEGWFDFQDDSVIEPQEIFTP